MSKALIPVQKSEVAKTRKRNKYNCQRCGDKSIGYGSGSTVADYSATLCSNCFNGWIDAEKHLESYQKHRALAHELQYHELALQGGSVTPDYEWFARKIAECNEWGMRFQAAAKAYLEEIIDGPEDED